MTSYSIYCNVNLVHLWKSLISTNNVHVDRTYKQGNIPFWTSRKRLYVLPIRFVCDLLTLQDGRAFHVSFCLPYYVSDHSPWLPLHPIVAEDAGFKMSCVWLWTITIPKPQPIGLILSMFRLIWTKLTIMSFYNA